MAKKLVTIQHAQMWSGKPKNGMVEVVIIEKFGKGPQWWRLWVPFKEKDDYFSMMKKIKNRMKHDHGVEVGHHSLLCSNENPLNDLINKEE